jgi:hypothetical protein
MHQDWIQDLFDKLHDYQFHTDQSFQAQYLTEVRARGISNILAELNQLLTNSDLEIRCSAARAILYIDRQQGVDLVLPLLADRDSTVRWALCEMLREFGDKRAIDGLVQRLQADSSPQIRSTAAGALGAIGSPQALSALFRAELDDHETDIHGHSAASVARNAISDILLQALLDYLQTHDSMTIDWQFYDDTRLRGDIVLLSNHDQQPEQDTSVIDNPPHAVYKSWGRLPPWIPYRNLPWHAYGSSIVGVPVITKHPPPFEVNLELLQEDRSVERNFIFGYADGRWVISTLFHRDAG